MYGFEEDGDDDDFTAPRGQAVRAKVPTYSEEDFDIGDDEDDHFVPPGAPVRRGGSSMLKKKRVSFTDGVPHEIREAAYSLASANADGIIHLQNSTLADLQRQVIAQPDMNTSIDPLVTIFDTIPTKDRKHKIYCKEVVPFSTLLVARFSECTYDLGTLADSKSFALVRVKMHDGVTKEFPHIQSLGCAEIVKWILQNDYPNAEEALDEVMMKIGVLSPEDISDTDAIKQYTNIVGKALVDSNAKGGAQ